MGPAAAARVPQPCWVAWRAGAGSLYQDELRNTSITTKYPGGRILQAVMNFTQGDKLWAVVGQMGLAGSPGARGTLHAVLCIEGLRVFGL